jgi:hypothetical protein
MCSPQQRQVAAITQRQASRGAPHLPPRAHLHRLVSIAAALLERLFAVHHARARLEAQRLDVTGADGCRPHQGAGHNTHRAGSSKARKNLSRGSLTNGELKAAAGAGPIPARASSPGSGHQPLCKHTWPALLWMPTCILTAYNITRPVSAGKAPSHACLHPHPSSCPEGTRTTLSSSRCSMHGVSHGIQQPTQGCCTAWYHSCLQLQLLPREARGVLLSCCVTAHLHRLWGLLPWAPPPWGPPPWAPPPWGPLP